ncbi:hypothetical protein [Planomonospora parontospora]|uniref:hypothetical protein n=1 Tax=Planomonospora parontospora TaxID=58119 RepID=UPI001670038A|nr:hypothetical protein [Planomonospora parontospora]GGL58869.1 hypothetical protein GCM10014719_70370 [Planomonospora parontospora subsp. antibiotica]GII20237.1 hypothetical protein Ppa05_69630 [Planomonospora parontospora subsp. antibiotica]
MIAGLPRTDRAPDPAHLLVERPAHTTRRAGPRRGENDPGALIGRVEAFHGRFLDLPDLPVLRTEPTDPPWANLTRPGPWLPDWAYRGGDPAGYGGAVSYLC